MKKEKGFWESLFDLTFSSFVLPKLVPVLYIIAIVFISLFILIYIVVAFSHNIFLGLLMLVVGAPIMFFLYLFSARLWLEALLILFRIREDLQEMKKEKETVEKPAEEETQEEN
ncbi:DUF4282 domain-containing protein [bacterium]|nr:DUF4282 domain-containing protein [bacterium]